jgi:hypothetical protein
MASGPVGGVLAIELELVKERASALRRAGESLEAALEKLSALKAKIDGGEVPSRAEAIAEYRELYAEAEKQRWYMVIQREAMGLKQHRELDELYPLPAKLR